MIDSYLPERFIAADIRLCNYLNYLYQHRSEEHAKAYTMLNQYRKAFSDLFLNPYLSPGDILKLRSELLSHDDLIVQAVIKYKPSCSPFIPTISRTPITEQINLFRNKTNLNCIQNERNL
jgi:hypothetical protein